MADIPAASTTSSSSSISSPSDPNSVASWRTWIVENKLRAVGTLWATGVVGSLAYNFRKPGEKMSVKLIHARLHAQALTLAALVAAAGVEYYEHSSGAKAARVEEQQQRGHHAKTGASAVQ